MSEDIGIDLGTATVLIYVKNKGIVLREPSAVAIDKKNNAILAYGKDAKKMIGRTPNSIETIRPLEDGVISNFTATAKMLKYFIKKACASKFTSNRIMVCVPAQITEVERRAVIDALLDTGTKKVFLIEEPVAAAIGAGIDISKPVGNLVIDVGGGTTDVAVISIGGSVVSTTINVAGDKFDNEIIKYVRKKYNMLIGKETAEKIKIEVGCVYPKEQTNSIIARGRNLETSLPEEVEIKSDELINVLLPSVIKIIEAVKETIEKAPPELVEDISEKGIYMTGGGSLLYGINKLIEESTGIKVMIAEDAISCVAIGTGKALDNINLLDERKKKC